MNIGFIAFGNAKGYDSKQSGILKASELSEKIYTTSIQDLFKEKTPDGRQADIVKIRFTKNAQGTISNDMTMYGAAIENNPPRPKFLGASIGITGAFLNPLEAKCYLEAILKKLYLQTNDRGQFLRDSIDWNQVDFPMVAGESLKKVSRPATHRDFSSRHALVVKVNDFSSDFDKIMQRFYDYGGMNRYTDVYLVREAKMFVSLKQAADRSQGEIAQFKGQARFIGSINDFSEVMLSVMNRSLKSEISNRDNTIRALDEQIKNLKKEGATTTKPLSQFLINQIDRHRNVSAFYQNYGGTSTIKNDQSAQQALKVLIGQLNNNLGADSPDDNDDAPKSNLSRWIFPGVIGFTLCAAIWMLTLIDWSFLSKEETNFTPPPVEDTPMSPQEEIEKGAKDVDSDIEDSETNDERATKTKKPKTKKPKTKEPKPDNTEENKPDNTEENKPDNTEENKPDNTEENKPDNTEENKPDNTEENKPDNTEENNTDNTEENKPDNTEENKPDNTEENSTDNTEENNTENKEEDKK